MSGRDLGLSPPLGHRHREPLAQPGRRAHPRRHLPDLLGERLLWTVLRAAPPAPLAPLQQHRTTTAGQIVRPVSTHSLPELDTARHTGHRAACGSLATS